MRAKSGQTKGDVGISVGMRTFDVRFRTSQRTIDGRKASCIGSGRQTSCTGLGRQTFFSARRERAVKSIRFRHSFKPSLMFVFHRHGFRCPLRPKLPSPTPNLPLRPVRPSWTLRRKRRMPHERPLSTNRIVHSRCPGVSDSFKPNSLPRPRTNPFRRSYIL